MTTSSYPIVLTDLHTKPCVVVGGGQVAERKVTGLLESDALVTVISPMLSPQLQCWAAQGRLRHIERAFRPGDLDGSALAVAATSDRQVNAEVAREARRNGILVNVVDDPEAGNFTTTATVRRGDLLLAISTKGASPVLAGMIRRKLERLFGGEYAELLALLSGLRRGAARHLPAAARSVLWRGLVSDQVLGWLRAGEREQVGLYVDELIRSAGTEDDAVRVDVAAMDAIPVDGQTT
ncbi:MAG TPA: bifunctional precorrin-2 dehydrogenase/sirohydrochlorin ferrochelatase [Herpetosiphonaceae bacterium]|nr:bifunctional precorrin-2 dehydrogenase/sirohydrochlorin ferrochelatase [Herpetosiphonaceae bacterium]